jgi:nucleotide-binding universal stress UspA family protein
MSSSADERGIVVAVDGSPGSMVATEWAVRHAAARCVPLSLAHVMSESKFGGWPTLVPTSDHAAWRDERGLEILDDAVSTARRAMLVHGPVEVEHRSYVGSIVPTLVDLSKDASMVVVGCRGLGAVKRRLLGSASSGLVHHAHCPVAVIHDELLSIENLSGAPILVGVDGSPASELATAIAFDEASRRGVELIAMHGWIDDDLHAWSGIDWDRQLEVGREALAERLAGWCERYPDVWVEKRLVSGDPKAELIAASDSAQLTVVGSHGRGGFAGMLLGSVSAAVVQAARMPVIVARSS